jgi:hypothetical protein
MPRAIRGKPGLAYFPLTVNVAHHSGSRFERQRRVNWVRASWSRTAAQRHPVGEGPPSPVPVFPGDCRFRVQEWRSKYGARPAGREIPDSRLQIQNSKFQIPNSRCKIPDSKFKGDPKSASPARRSLQSGQVEAA